jgi:hypothetical protein
MKLSILALSIISFSSLADSVYLNCNAKSTKGEVTEFSVKLSEDNSEATHSYKGGATLNTEAFFTANSIKYKDFTNLGEVHFTKQFEINRTSLEVVIMATIEPADKSFGIAPTHTFDKGICEIEEVKKRKI